MKDKRKRAFFLFLPIFPFRRFPFVPRLEAGFASLHPGPFLCCKLLLTVPISTPQKRWIDTLTRGTLHQLHFVPDQ